MKPANFIQSRIGYLNKVITDKEAALNNAPDGRLKIHTRGGTVSHYVKIDQNGNGIYLPKNDIKTIAALAQKSYDNKVITKAKAEMKVLEHLCGFYSKNITADEYFNTLSPMRQNLVKPLSLTDAQYIEMWKKKHPPRSKGKPDTAYQTLKGDYVRSRAEILISDRIYMRNHIYQYETPLRIEGILFHPDFCILNLRLRKTVYWEHFGMLDVPQYLESAIEKLNIYARNGIIIGKNLIITFETKEQPFNTAQIDPLIDLFIE